MPTRAGASAPQNPRGKSRDPFEDFERDQWKRPRIPLPGKSGRADLPKAGYTRASTLGETLEEQYGLGQWRLRQAIYGLSRRKDLLVAAQAVRSNEGEDRKRLGAIVDDCLDAAESSAGATWGTAIHALSQMADEGDEEGLRHIEGEARDALDAYRAVTSPFRMLAAERQVVCDGHRVAGTFDRLLAPLGPMLAPDGTRIPAGTPMIGDLKTSSTADYFGLKFAVQFAEYAHGLPFDVQRYVRQEWADLAPEADRPHQEWGLLIHVPTGAPESAGLFWVDLESGRALSEMAIEVRSQRARRDLIVPARPPSIPETLTRHGIAQLILATTTREEVDALWLAHRSQWDDHLTRIASAHMDQRGIPRRADRTADASA